ncbi:RluA family pseudouridine synthase [Cellulosilyticum sp. I15G10I2]|uniref:RluA family pseudouridine synthase n=1 Tax=Cellulosilyticum sp. I15G10I2 TaxID=1892843 RepID=UPI00085BCCE5|nr:RluA family pseudouridine synthase [Cellulosilyticum sp. I15G10I2]
MAEQINIVSTDQEGIRLDKYLAEKLQDYTRSFLQKLIDEKHVTVNNKYESSKYKIKINDSILVEVPDPIEVNIVAEPIPIDIVYEDKDIIIINKPQDMVVHPAPGNYRGTLVNALLYHCKDNLSGINGEIRPGIVHRIDKDTSGLLMIAKNDKAHLKLSTLLKEHDISRKYHAIVYGVFKEMEGIVEAPIGRSHQDRKKMAITDGGRYAKTHYKVLETYKNFSYIELTLYTGRTHQIRVHMKHIGHPLLGDPVYGPQKLAFGIDMQMLHAKTLGFVHPSIGKYMEFDSDLPQYFTIMIDKLRKT